MKTILITMLILIGIIWIGCRKDDYCWHCEWETPQGYTEDTWDTLFCDRSDEWIDSLDSTILIDPQGHEYKFLGCDKQ